MNNFLDTEIDNNCQLPEYRSFHEIYLVRKKRTVKKWMISTLIGLIVILFLPWTQNIRAKGSVTTIRPEQRPQQVNNIIAGRVVKWYVKEGDFVQAGDTLLQLGEVKVDYLDPQLLDRTKEQITAKTMSGEGYQNKASTAAAQVTALELGRDLKLNQIDIKLKQQQLKVESDSMDLAAVQNELSVAQRQIDAAKRMLDSGVISLVDFERRKVTYQNAQAKRISAENKFLQSKQELTALRIEKNSTVQEYTDKIAKAEGDRYSALSSLAATNADISKLQNMYASYDLRNQLYYVLAPQSGQIIQAKKAGIGEMVKEGDSLVEIVPDKFQFAVEMFVEPMDQPLVNPGQKVRFVFDGFPAIVFSGWPMASYGTFGGVVKVVEKNTSKEGKFRVLVAEDPESKPWPKELRMGGGANGIALLKNVPVWYELWRNINGFPPDYYVTTEPTAKEKK